MLNLKGVRFRVYGGEAQTLRISKKGKGAVTAKDIQTNADVEIVNPDQVIATIDDDKGKLVMDLTVEDRPRLPHHRRRRCQEGQRHDCAGRHLQPGSAGTL